MTTSFFHPEPGRPLRIEPSARTAFAGNRLIRDSEHRADDCVDQALARDGSHSFAFSGNRIILKHDGQVLDPLFAPYELKDLDPDLDAAILLGHTPSGEPRLAVPVRAPEESLASHHKLVDARTVLREGLMGGEMLGEFGQAAAMIAWNQSNAHCGSCGAATLPKAGGFRRECTGCGRPSFPRTDPVVIMLTVDLAGRRCLLGRGSHFPPRMMSALAGFLEPGETIEESVRRETHEESGIRIGRVIYHASQPWPMPHSLMIGCYGEALTDTLHRDESELEDLRWFSVEEIEAMRTGDETHPFALPQEGTIARLLIIDWLRQMQAGAQV